MYVNLYFYIYKYTVCNYICVDIYIYMSKFTHSKGYLALAPTALVVGEEICS